MLRSLAGKFPLLQWDLVQGQVLLWKQTALPGEQRQEMTDPRVWGVGQWLRGSAMVPCSGV